MATRGSAGQRGALVRKIMGGAWGAVGKYLDPDTLIRLWDRFNEDDRIVRFFQSMHLPRSLDPVASIEIQLDAIEELLDSDVEFVSSKSLIAEWRQALRTFRTAAKLASAAKGRSKREMIRDLKRRVNALYNDVYEHLLASCPAVEEEQE